MKFYLLVIAGLVQLGKCSVQDLNHHPPALPGRGKRDSPTKPTNPMWNATWTDKLKHDLLVNYDKFARPTEHNNQTSVALKPYIRHIELDERRSVMTLHAFTRMEWNDEKLKWDPSHYNGLKQLHLADHEIWQPDILPYNSASGSAVDHYGNTNLLVSSNGTVVWVPPSIFHVFCEFDFKYWPFDKQRCALKIGSWTYSGEEIDLVNDDHGQTVYEVHSLLPNAEWDFVSMYVEKHTETYSCCTESYIDLSFYVTVKRHSDTYKALVITPASVLVLITLAIFWLPPTSGDKITLGAAAVITNCIFILYFTQKMPVMTGSTPYIVSFYSRCVCLIAFALLIAVAVINIAGNPKSTPLPWILKRNLRGCLGKCLLINYPGERNSLKSEEMADNQPVLSDQGRNHSEEESKSYQNDWILLAMVIDRIFFLLYCLAFALLAIIYSV